MDKMMESTYLCVVLHVKLKKLPILAFFTWFLTLGQILFSDRFWWRHRPPAAPPPIKYTSSCWEDQRLSTEVKIVSKYCNISTTRWRVSNDPPPPPPHPCTTAGVWVCLHVQGLNEITVSTLKESLRERSRVFAITLFFHHFYSYHLVSSATFLTFSVGFCFLRPV